MNSNPDPYFAHYENLEIHDLMLKDRPRQEAYFKAIWNNRDQIKDRIVIDVGAGTGILSAFMAKAGAKLVFAVEASDLAKVALEVIEENQLTSVVKVIRSKIEDFVLPSTLKQVDIIVSEWMGFYLFHEGMLDSVIYARDKFLREDGLMFPIEASLLISPCSVPSLYKYYENVDGIKMNSFAKKLREQKMSKPEILALKEEDLLLDGTVMYHMNLMEITMEELEEIEYSDSFAVERAGRFEGFCIWFETGFPSIEPEDAISLETGPDAPETHWKQCVVVLPPTACADMEKDMPISFKVKLRRNAINRRHYNMEIELEDPELVEHPMPCNCHMTKCIVLKAHLERISMGIMAVDEDVHQD